jgi:CheY-like chemotaxis protein
MGTELYGGRVLVVDDDGVNRMLLTRSLEREGTMAALSLLSRVRTSAERRPVRGDERRAPLSGGPVSSAMSFRLRCVVVVRLLTQQGSSVRSLSRPRERGPLRA